MISPNQDRVYSHNTFLLKIKVGAKFLKVPPYFEEVNRLMDHCDQYRPNQDPEHIGLINLLKKSLVDTPVVVIIEICDYIYDPMKPFMKGVQYNIPVKL